MTLKIALLGEPQLSREGRPLKLPGYRPFALLAYLLITGRPHSRQHLAELLFERAGDPRGALRWTLSQLRRVIGAETVLADRQTVAFNFNADYWLDVAAFEAGDLDLYRGELLEGLYLRDARLFNAWLLVEQERLRTHNQAGLERRLLDQQEKSEGEAAEQTALKLLGLDNLREDWHRALMEAYAQQGKFAAALAQYEFCRQILLQELDAHPTRKTVELAEVVSKKKAQHSRLAAQTRVVPAAEPLSPEHGLASPLAELDGGRRRYPVPTRTVAVFAILALIVILGLAALNDEEALRGLVIATDDDNREKAGAGLTGRTVTIAVPLGEEEMDLFMRSLEPFIKQTGLQIEVGSFEGDLDKVLPSLVDSGLAPDIVSIAQPGLLAEFVRRGQVVDVTSFLDESYLRQQYSPALLEAAQIEGQMAGVWYKNNIKSLVWYPKPSFAVAGYQVPQTWEALMELSAQISASRATPWCIGIESGAATGWVGTDWVEDILLRTAPTDTYDKWVAGEWPFDSPELRNAFDIMEAIWREDTFVYGGQEAIVSRSFVDSFMPMLEEPPGCFLHKQGSFLLEFFPEDAVFGEDYDFFYLPPIDPAYGSPVLGGGDMMVMFNDRPEVRELMRYLTTPESVRYFVEEGGAISPHRNTPFEWYATIAQLRMAQILLEADTYRFDGSDAMPPEVGTGSFWRGIVAWAEGADTRDVLQGIDESRSHGAQP